MAIRPVDYQILMPRVNETGKVQSETNQRMVGQAQQQADNAQKLADHDTKTVHSQEEAQRLTINHDEAGNSGQQEPQKKKKAKADKANKEADKDEILLPQERTTIDIRI